MVSSKTKERSSINGSSINNNSLTPFGTRTNKFVVLSSVNLQNTEDMGKVDGETDEDNIVRKVKPGERCTLMTHRSQPTPGCRFMYDKIEDKVLVFLGSPLLVGI